MSEIILNWLNDQIQLSKRITSFEEDFNNGFLFGELLGKYNQQLNFSEFLNKDDKKSKLRNFQLLFDTFTALKVTFNSSVANDIINKKSGVAKKLLYELKMNLQKTLSASQGGNAFTKMTKMTKTLSPLKKIKVSKEQYDKVDKEHFVHQLNQLHPAQKSINQQKVLKKFSDFHEHQIVITNQQAQKQTDAKLSQQRKFRQKQRDNLKKTADFRIEWQRSNIQKWSANMTVRNIQNEKETMFKTKLEQTKFQNKTTSQLNAIKSLDKDINDFERKFIKGANKKKKISEIQDSDESDDANNNNNNTNAIPQVLELKKHESKLQSKINFPSGNNSKVRLESPSKSKKLGPQNEQEKHQREKKRRKMIVEQNKRYQLIEISRRQKYIMSTIQQTSKQEKELEYEIWRVWQNKELIKENKKLKEEKVNEKNEVREINAKFKRDELLKTYRQEHEVEVNQSVTRQQKLLKDHAVAQRKSTYQECKKIVEQFLSISEQLFLNQQQTNSLEISSHLVDHLFSEFVEGVSKKNQIAELEIKNYVHGSGEWNLIPKRKTQDQPTDPTQDNALPQKPVNNFYLGNTLRFLYQNKFLNSQQVNTHQNNSFSSEYLISLLGLQFNGKHVAASSLQKNHNFNIIEIEKLIFKKIQEYEEIKNKVSQISEDTKNVAEFAYAGKEIPNELIIKLIKEEVSKNPRSVLLNFPISYKQALSLTKQLKGVQPSDFIPKSDLEKKVESFSRLVLPSASTIVPKPVRQCGVDMALWVDIPEKQSYDRFLGRRWLDDKIVSIHDDVADDVRKLKVGDKASSQILKNYKKVVEKQNLQQFFNEFGIEVKPEQIIASKQIQEFKQGQQNQHQITTESNTHEILKSWSQINGQCPIQELQKRVLQKIQQTMRIKTKKQQQLSKQAEQLKKKNQQKAENEKKQEQIKQKCVYSGQQVIKSRLENALSSMKLPSQFISSIITLWQSTQSTTITSLRQCFQFISSQRASQNDYISQAKRNFINLLIRDDKKFSLVKRFQIDYNNFLDENKEMIEQEFTKEELHQRVDDLEEQLFDIIELKKQDAMEEKKNNAESGWIESQLEQFYHTVRIILQAQLNRYNCSEKILNDFYSKRYAITQNPTDDNNPIEINYDTTLQMITKDGQFPRLQKLISETMRLFSREQEVVEDKGKKGGKAPPAAKKDDKKGGKKVQVEQTKEPTAQQLQLKKAINIQKSIFRYRVTLIADYTQQRLSQFIKRNQILFKQLQSYYLYTYQIENRCITNLSKIFRAKIQLQQKIENQFAVEYVDVIQNEKIRNFEKEKVVVLPAKEILEEDRLTVTNVRELVEFVKNQAQSQEKVSSKRLIQIIKYLKNNMIEKQILPANWKTLEEGQIESFVNSLDADNMGHVELWKFIVFVVLSNFTTPNSKEIEVYYNDLTAYGTVKELSREKFVNTKAWFDEEYEKTENVRTFRRNEHIKEILFDVFKVQVRDNEYVDAQRVCRSVDLLEWYRVQESRQEGSYFDAAFKRE